MKPSHIIVLVIILVLLFGASKLPDLARSLGQSAKILKKEMRELQDDDAPVTQQSAATQAQLPAQPTQAASQTGVTQPPASPVPPTSGTEGTETQTRPTAQ